MTNHLTRHLRTLTFLAIAVSPMVLSATGCAGGDDPSNPPGDGDTSTETGGNTGTGGSAEPGNCTNCDNGCCDGDTCVPYSAQSADQCGTEGLSCQACEFGEMCSGGECQTDFDVCSPLSCKGGCCDSGECVGDTYWGACGAAGEVCSTCEYGVECGDDGSCTSFIHDDAVFTVAIHSVELEQTNLGASWDVGSAPEPFVCITNGTEEACTDAECGDSLTCSFPLSGELELTFTGAELKTNGIDIVVWDDDGIAHDQAGAVNVLFAEVQDSYVFDPFGAVVSLELSLQ